MHLELRLVELVPSRHPGRRLQLGEPIGHAWNATTTIFFDVLLGDIAHGHLAAIAVDDGATKQSFGFEDALGVMAQGAMPEIGKALLGGIEPIMDGEIIFGLAAPKADGAVGMECGMRQPSARHAAKAATETHSAHSGLSR